MKKIDFMKLKTPKEGDRLLERLAGDGFEAYYVGGCVRDLILGVEPKDWDICTDATPEEMKRSFSGYKTIDTGIKHGTLTVILDQLPFEVTTYRIDGRYSDHRRPDFVAFSGSLADDLSRRDFTVNAMAFHPAEGLVDLFAGRRDLEQGILRCVGKPVERFEEDALRIMRALRFASRLDFQIEEDTGKALLGCGHLLDRIAVERIRAELDQFLCGPGVRRLAGAYRDVMGQIIPEVRPMFDLDQENPYHAYDVWEHTLRVVENSPKSSVSRLAALFHDMGKPAVKTVDEEGRGHFYGHEKVSLEVARRVMDRLKYDNATREKVLTLVQYHGIVFQPTDKYARKLLRRLGEENLFLLIGQSLADVKSQHPDCVARRVDRIEAFRHAVESVLAKAQCFSLKDLAVKGDDLLRLGIPQGEEVGRCLNILLERVIEGEVKNQREDLLALIEKRR